MVTTIPFPVPSIRSEAIILAGLFTGRLERAESIDALDDVWLTYLQRYANAMPSDLTDELRGTYRLKRDYIRKT